jgi:hypothetical protein
MTTKNTELKKFNVSEQVFLNWECQARDEKHARELYEQYITDKKNLIEECLCAMQNKWDDQIEVEEIKD